MGRFNVLVFTWTDDLQASKRLLDCHVENDIDWYTYGGDEQKILPLADGSYTAAANMQDVPLDYVDTEKYKKAYRLWMLICEGLTPQTEEDKGVLRKYKVFKKYLIDKYESAEQYALCCSTIQYCCAITPDGTWIDSDSYSDKEWIWHQSRDLLRKAQQEGWFCTVFLCHG